MAVNKKNEFSDDEVILADLAKALAHPARIAILKFLAKKNVCICGEIVDEMPLAQSTVSQHLKELKKVDLIDGEVDGPKICYCIDWDQLNKFSNYFESLITTLQQKNCCNS